MNRAISKIFKLLGQTIFRKISWTGCAVALVILFGVLHFLGWRVDTAIISGTMAPSAGESKAMILRGVFYGLSYFAALILAPILIIATAFYEIFRRVFPRLDPRISIPPQSPR